jgi:hypothetical protein
VDIDASAVSAQLKKWHPASELALVRLGQTALVLMSNTHVLPSFTQPALAFATVVDVTISGQFVSSD